LAVVLAGALLPPQKAGPPACICRRHSGRAADGPGGCCDVCIARAANTKQCRQHSVL